MESLTTFLPNLGDSNRGSSSLVQGSLDDLLSGLDKENEENKQNLNRKPSSTLERERERASRLRPLTDLTDNSNQITKLPDIVNSQPYAQVNNLRKRKEIINHCSFIFLLSKIYRKLWQMLPGWTGMAQAPPTLRDSSCPWT